MSHGARILRGEWMAPGRARTGAERTPERSHQGVIADHLLPDISRGRHGNNGSIRLGFGPSGVYRRYEIMPMSRANASC
jgi:hypothetical protein